MNQLNLFGAGVPIVEERIHGERRGDVEHSPPPPRVVGYVRQDPESMYVICPATSIGSMDKEHVELGTWEVQGRAMALARRVAVNLYKIETDGAWTPLGRIGADGARVP